MNKHLLHIFLLSLFVASFLASCTTGDPTNIINNDGTVNPTVACPEGLILLTLDGATELALTDDLITVTAGDDFTDPPTFTYDPAAVTTATTSVTVTATDAVDTTVTAMCDFNVSVSDTPVTLTACPDDINNAVINLARTWTAPTITDGPEDATVAVSVTSDDATASTATVSETGGTFTEAGTYTVAFTATTADASPIVGTDGSLSCSFDVVVNDMALPLMAICPETSTTPLSVVIPFGETTVTLTEELSGVSSTGGEGIVMFSYDPDMFTLTDIGTPQIVIATATDSATPTPATSTCTFTVTVTQALEPMLTTCSSTGNAIINTPFTWTAPTIENPPTGATVEVSVALSDGAATTQTGTLTGATFTELGTYMVTFTATDSSDMAITVNSTPLTCDFMVIVTATPQPTIENCPMNMTGIVGVYLTWTPPTSTNLPANTRLEIDITPSTFINITREGATFLAADTYTVTFTARRNENPIIVNGEIQNSPEDLIVNGMVLVCEFEITISDPPTISNCPDALNGIINMPITWDPLMLADAPDGSSISGPTIAPTTGVESMSATGATFSTADTYTVTFTAMNANNQPIRVDGRNLTCRFMVFVADKPKLPGSAFFLADESAIPSSSNPFLIQNTADLSELARVVNGNVMYSNINVQNDTEVPYRSANYRLDNDITLTGDNNFTPIGNVDGSTTNAFEGTFDGSNNTISGLHFSNNDKTDETSTNVGLFGVISGTSASISNLILTDVDIWAISNTGALVGTMVDNSSVSNVFSKGSIIAFKRVGGLIGQMIGDSSMTNAGAAVTILNTNVFTLINGPNRVGGLVGAMTNASMTNVFASGDVKATNSATFGGLVGTVSNSTITNAYASGDVFVGGGQNVAGLIGTVTGTTFRLTNAIAWGEVQEKQTPTVDARIGGLIGTGGRNITDSYWDKMTTGQTVSEGSPDSNGLDTTDLQIADGVGTIYSNWNNIAGIDLDMDSNPDTPWTFAVGQYPRLDGLIISVACQRNPEGNDCP